MPEKHTTLNYVSSARVKSPSKLVKFLYEILNCNVPPNVIEEIFTKMTEDEATGDGYYMLDNGWVARYAEDIARCLLEDGISIDNFSVGV